MLTAQGMIKPKRLEFDKKSKSNYYGKLNAGPFERGYGVTIGNSLRRMLLSSIEGAAIVAVKFEGVFHEFSSIPGVVEDVTEIILNLKQVNLQLLGDEPYKRIYIKASEIGVVYAKDITADPDVVVLNPDLPILTIDSESNVEIEMIVRRGRGYVPADKHIIENESVQMIPVAANFSPIEKITFNVENTRVGQSTDYDSLVMELWTNGGITPEDAVAHAAKIVKDHMQIFI
ncbi:MAG TPA: DNA-directed RNA polymerase subunit alpha, partial [Nitrospinaceae bacterium]|nr:DNA-directed RNA polymerase subunit alpha [Nitrospinaceae bacterium]